MWITATRISKKGRMNLVRPESIPIYFSRFLQVGGGVIRLRRSLIGIAGATVETVKAKVRLGIDEVHVDLHLIVVG